MTTLKFDEDFINKALALYLRDKNFCERTDGLIRPELFETEIDAYICRLVSEHYNKYAINPSMVSVSQKFKEDQANNLIRKELVGSIGSKFKQLYKVDISDREFVIERITDYVRKQATVNAIVKSAEILDNGGDVNEIIQLVQKAVDVGTSELNSAYDFKDAIAQRSEIRKARLKGEVSWNSVSTGFKAFDDILYRKGWGKGELTLYMGPSKGGKSIALLEHALRAAERGFNVLFVSLEVSTEIQVDRMDSNISGVKMDDLYVHIDKVDERVRKWADKAANLKLHEYPTGTFGVTDLRRLVKKYQASGLVFDLVVVDYADIMKTESNSLDNIDKSKAVLIGLRALAQGENVAILSATQTNREGAKVETIEAIHVAEDYNKIRIADLVISINANEVEKTVNEARLFLAASRNQKPFTITIKRDLSIMKHIKEIVEVK